MQSKIASLPTGSGGNYDSDIDNIYVEIESLRDNFDGILAEVDDMLAEWEEEQQTTNSSSNSSNSGTTRWDLDVSSSYNISDVLIDVFVSPSRIEEADVYKIRLTIYNRTVVEVKDLCIYLDLTPKSGDVVFVNDKNTFLDTTRSPYYWWDTEVITRGEDNYTRRISSTSEKITVPAAVSNTQPSETSLTLELNLEYK